MPMSEHPHWGKKKKPAGPEDFLAELIQKIRDFFDQQEGGGDAPKSKEPPPEGNGHKPNFLAGAGKVAAVILAVLILRGLFACFYTIKPNEQGVVLRFGKYDRTAEPGLRFKIPYMETMERVDVKNIRKEEFGVSTRMPGQNNDLESLMLTGDKNVIEVAWSVQYTVKDPFYFLFKVRNVPQAVRDNSETVIRRTVGNMDFDYVLGNRTALANMAKQELQRDLDDLKTGVDLVTLQLLDITPTDQVKPAFNEVNEADQDMKRLVNEAETKYNEVIPKAEGSAKQIVEEAYGYKVQRINNARGEIARFKAIAAEYAKAKEVTRQRMYLETMQDILPNISHLYVMDSSGQPVLPFLNLNSDGRQQMPLTDAEQQTAGGR